MNFLRRKKYSLIACFMALVVLIYPWLVILENPPPRPENLQRVHVKIVQVKDQSPNIKAEMPDGKIQEFEFPPSNYALVQGFPREGFFYEHKNELQNCSGYIDYDVMRFLILRKTLRIWGIQCEKSSISYFDIFQSFEKSRNFGIWIDAAMLLFAFLFCGFLLYGEGREKWASQ